MCSTYSSIRRSKSSQPQKFFILIPYNKHGKCIEFNILNEKMSQLSKELILHHHRVVIIIIMCVVCVYVLRPCNIFASSVREKKNLMHTFYTPPCFCYSIIWFSCQIVKYKVYFYYDIRVFFVGHTEGNKIIWFK